MIERAGYLVTFYGEVIYSFYKNRRKIAQTLCENKAVHHIQKIIGNFSDVHNEGRQVLRVWLDTGTKILYKPHAMENEELYAKLLNCAAEKTGVEQYTYPILFYDTHSWCSVVEYDDCKSEQELKSYKGEDSSYFYFQMNNTGLFAASKEAAGITFSKPH